jgi:hypothetical protein
MVGKIKPKRTVWQEVDKKNNNKILKYLKPNTKPSKKIAKGRMSLKQKIELPSKLIRHNFILQFHPVVYFLYL